MLHPEDHDSPDEDFGPTGLLLGGRKSEAPFVHRERGRRAGQRLTLCLCVFAMGALALAFLFLTAAHRSQGHSSSESGEEGKESCPDGYGWNSLRLPTDIVPVHYTLHIHPNISQLSFAGKAEIRVRALAETGRLILHSRELGVGAEAGLEESESEVTGVDECPAWDQRLYSFHPPLKKGEEAVLVLSFNGTVELDYSGLYLSTTKNSRGEDVKSFITQFESTAAREMFPCFDEPDKKAIFKVFITREKEHIGLANAAKAKTRDIGEGLVEDEFEETLKMSTYLVAIGILNGYGSVSTTTNLTSHPIHLSVYAPVELVDATGLALWVGERGLSYLENFFLQPFPLHKQDLVALADFAAGAMENWGLITFRDHMLLASENTTTTKTKEFIATVVVHELAHQWFGNLVTMKWWSDLWLNEGFASFIESFVTAKIKPEWKLMDSFFMDTVATAMYLDGLHSSHPISVPVSDPSEIDSIFDAISYQKGSSIIQMLMDITGEIKFQAGLQDYLNKHKYGNAESKDLWDALQQSLVGLEKVGDLGGVGLEEFATVWTTVEGHPLVTVALDPSKGTLSLSQQRFLYLRDEDDKSSNDTIWPLSITYVTDKEPTPTRFWFNSSSTVHKDKKLRGARWVKLNKECVGFYRTLYDSDMYHSLADQLVSNMSVFSAADRAGLLYDAFSLAKAGLVPVNTVFTLLQYARKERARAPLQVIHGQLERFRDLLFSTDEYTLIHAYQRSLVEPVYRELGWGLSSDHQTRLLQLEILSDACRLKIPDCLRQAKNQFRVWKTNPSKYHPKTAIHLGVEFGSEEDWDAVFKAYNSSLDPSEKNYLLTALAHTTDPWTISRILRLTLDPTVVKSGVIHRVYGAVAASHTGKYFVWRFVRQHWPAIAKILGDTSMVGYAIRNVVQDFVNQFDYDEVAEWVGTLELGQNKAAVEQTLEGLRINLQWSHFNLAHTQHWLRAHYAPH